MTLQNMYGVVLWSDRAAQKAVIWCEDQGDLAYYAPVDATLHDAPVLDAGDLIQFDVTVQKNMRRAINPQLLQPSHSPDLPGCLRERSATPGQAVAHADCVVSLADFRTDGLSRRIA